MFNIKLNTLSHTKLKPCSNIKKTSSYDNILLL